MSGRAAGERAQAAVEVALVLPLLAVLALALLQVALVVRDQVLVVHAAREAAREAAVSDGEEAPRRAALSATALAADRLEIDVTPRGEAGSLVRAEVRYASPTEVPIVGRLVGEVDLSASAAMRVET